MMPPNPFQVQLAEGDDRFLRDAFDQVLPRHKLAFTFRMRDSHRPDKRCGQALPSSMKSNLLNFFRFITYTPWE